MEERATYPAANDKLCIRVGAEGFSCDAAARMCGRAVGTIKREADRRRRKIATDMQIDRSDAMELTDRSMPAMTARTPAAGWHGKRPPAGTRGN